MPANLQSPGLQREARQVKGSATQPAILIYDQYKKD